MSSACFILQFAVCKALALWDDGRIWNMRWIWKVAFSKVSLQNMGVMKAYAMFLEASPHQMWVSRATFKRRQRV